MKSTKMKNREANILYLLETQVRRILKEQLPSGCYFHNLEHTLDVVRAVNIIGAKVGLSYSELFIVQVAAWLHDLGFIYKRNGHEEESAKLAVLILSGYDFDDATICGVVSCIKATKFSQQPSNLLEKVMCDADLYHLSTFRYFHRSQLLRKEIEAVEAANVSDEEFIKGEIAFLKSHSYYTSYGRNILSSRKYMNVLVLKQVRSLAALNTKVKKLQNGLFFDPSKYPIYTN